MICERCKKEFNNIATTKSEPYDRGDGVMYGTASWTSNNVCPHCGHDNTPKTYMKR